MDGSQFHTQYPVVLRLEGLFPAQLAGYEMHRSRKGGDIGHVDTTKSYPNRLLIGGEDWAREAVEEIATIKAQNFADELDALEKRKRQKNIKRRIAEGPHDPWRPTQHGPLREIILTANKNWFASDPSELLGEEPGQLIAEFERLAVAWLKKEFGDDVIHARADLDEEAYHIHAVVLPRVRVEMTRKGKNIATRLMLQPSKFAIIEDYEKAQDSVGDWFSQIGLVRGERRKKAAREAYAAGEKPPPKRFHVKPRTWRIEKDRELTAREAAVAIREDEAEAVIAVAEALSEGAVDLAASTPEKLQPAEGRSGDPSWQIAEAAFKKAPSRAGIVVSAFGKAWQALWPRAQRDAGEEVRADLTAAFDRVSEAETLLRQAEPLLPAAGGKKLSEIRAAVSGLVERAKWGVARYVIASERRKVSENGDKEDRESKGL